MRLIVNNKQYNKILRFQKEKNKLYEGIVNIIYDNIVPNCAFSGDENMNDNKYVNGNALKRNMINVPKNGPAASPLNDSVSNI